MTLVSGEDNEEAVILLHGGPGVPEDMSPLTEYLAKKYRVICFHQRGTVNSPCPEEDYSMQSYNSDINAIASHFGLRKFHLFGHSWGGLYAGIYADKHPEKILSLFLCSPASGTGKQWLKMGLEVGRFNKKKSSFWEWMGMLRNSFLGTLGFNRGHRNFHRQFGVNANKGYDAEDSAPLLPHLVRARQINRTNKQILKYPKLKELPAPDFPISVTYGDDDIYGESSNYVKQRYPTARFITIPNCSHMHWLHNKEVFYKVLREHFG